MYRLIWTRILSAFKVEFSPRDCSEESAVSKITLDELEDIFGDAVPLEAFQLLASSGASALTIDQARARLIEIAGVQERSPQAVAMRDLVDAISAWIEK